MEKWSKTYKRRGHAIVIYAFIVDKIVNCHIVEILKEVRPAEIAALRGTHTGSNPGTVNVTVEPAATLRIIKIWPAVVGPGTGRTNDMPTLGSNNITGGRVVKVVVTPVEYIVPTGWAICPPGDILTFPFKISSLKGFAVVPILEVILLVVENGYMS